MGSPLRGGIYWVNDDLISLPPNDGRTHHPRRTVIVISGVGTNEDPKWPTVMVIPTSTHPGLKTEFCVQIGQGIGNMPKKCWARVVATQPVAKEDLQDRIGILPANYLELMFQKWAEYTELI